LRRISEKRACKEMIDPQLEQGTGIHATARQGRGLFQSLLHEAFRS